MSVTSQYLPQETIIRKRDGGVLDKAEIARFVAGIKDGSVSEGQVAAFAMAVFLNGMTPDEGSALALAMRDSGTVLDWQALGLDAGAPVVDKHSTGGVGDKVSLMLAPVVAACGGYVPMISGRGLGHTGGTLDKLESIPGYDAYPDNARFAAIVRDVGCSIIGQTGDLAPADKRFYAIRDVTGTVESVPLITASILSKKLAAGLGALVMDVKMGSGAFMKTPEAARTLAENIVRVADLAGTPTTAVLTDMNEVLGRTAGNAVEVLETIDFLKNPAGADPRLMDVTLTLAAHMLALSGAVPAGVETARAKAAEALDSGRAAELFAQMVVAQGGPADLMDRPAHHLPLAAETRAVTLGRSGTLTAMDTFAIGMAVVALGGGRTDPKSPVDHGVGVTDIAALGQQVGPDDPVAHVYARDAASADQAVSRIKAAMTLDSGAVPGPVIGDVILSPGQR
ncbi:thymidine phosphorylase [Yunchengibacter salinarum]|uniref:thymidine phosphorylase n=1 Tax=Yunchengibacter salinarum TaxID=3133399 RepID=UPI0035B5D891